MALVEYLYVDEERLDTYFEQISSPVTYDKVPMWNAEIGLIGPKAGGTQQRFARPFTVHEKISKLTKYLEDEGLVGYGRAGEQDAKVATEDRKLFRIETCRAKRVFIPPDHGQPPEVGALNVWISAVPLTKAIKEKTVFAPGNLYLLEDDRRRNDQPKVPYMSAYSVVTLMLDQGIGAEDLPTREEYREAIESKGGPLPMYFDNLEFPFRDAEEPRKKSFFRYFFLDPVQAFAHLGAQIGPERRIRTLYRVRVQFPEYELQLWHRYDIATFAYPIFIAEDTDPV
jgi:hypothetical protein